MLDHLYTGELDLEKFNLAEEKLNSLFAEEKDLKKFETKKCILYKLEPPEIIFSLMKKNIGFVKETYVLSFENKIRWQNYSEGFEEYYNFFIAKSNKLLDFYKSLGARNLTTWSDWGEKESELFDKKILKF